MQDADPAPPSLRGAIDLALDAYARLTGVAEEVEDEWLYVNDLVTAYRGRLERLAAADGDAPIAPSVAAALVAAADEIAGISDPHRAIDWLSTFPNVVALAIGRPFFGQPQ